MATNERLAELEAERDELELPYFNEEVAWRIGCRIRDEAAAGRLPVAIEVSRTGGRLFYCAMPGAMPDNEAWVRRKRNVVERFLQSSLYMTVKADAAGTTVVEKYKLSPEDYVHSGGGVAVRVTNCGCLGAVTVSGLNQVEDHRLAVAALRWIKAELSATEAA